MQARWLQVDVPHGMVHGNIEEVCAGLVSPRGVNGEGLHRGGGIGVVHIVFARLLAYENKGVGCKRGAKS